MGVPSRRPPAAHRPGVPAAPGSADGRGARLTARGRPREGAGLLRAGEIAADDDRRRARAHGGHHPAPAASPAVRSRLATAAMTAAPAAVESLTNSGRMRAAVSGPTNSSNAARTSPA